MTWKFTDHWCFKEKMDVDRSTERDAMLCRAGIKVQRTKGFRFHVWPHAKSFMNESWKSRHYFEEVKLCSNSNLTFEALNLTITSTIWIHGVLYVVPNVIHFKLFFAPRGDFVRSNSSISMLLTISSSELDLPLRRTLCKIDYICNLWKVPSLQNSKAYMYFCSRFIPIDRLTRGTDSQPHHETGCDSRRDKVN